MAMSTTKNFGFQKPSASDVNQTALDLITAVSNNADGCDYQLNRLSTAIRCYGDPTNNGMIAFYPTDNNIYVMPKNKVIFRNYGSNGTTNVPCTVSVIGNFTVSGIKQRIVQTDDYGTRGLNAIESAECYFIDRYEGKLVNGKCDIIIDKVWAETVNLSIGYDVNILKYGKGDIYPIKNSMTETGFTVEGENDIEFTAIVYAKQKGYENHRLEEDTLFEDIKNNASNLTEAGKLYQKSGE